MLYQKFYGLSEVPYKINPDSRYLFYSDQHKEAKFKCEYHLTQKDGPIYLSADVGLGKTTIAQRLLEELSKNPKNKVVFVFAPNLKTSNQLLRFLCDEFEVKTHRSYIDTLRSFEDYLFDRHQKGSTQILLIDEAQNLPFDSLKLIHHFFNFATRNEFLIQIAMFGQTELHKKIKRYKSLSSRMYVARLDNLSPQDNEAMLRFRWQVAGGAKFPFNKEALAEIYKMSGGNPRFSVKLAHEGLLLAALDQRQIVGADEITAAAADAFSEG